MQIAIGSYDHARALKDGSVGLPAVSFDFVEVSPITRQLTVEEQFPYS
jgi:hypothetical protein